MKITHIDREQALRENADPASFDGDVRVQRLIGQEQTTEIEMLVRISAPRVGVLRTEIVRRVRAAYEVF